MTGNIDKSRWVQKKNKKNLKNKKKSVELSESSKEKREFFVFFVVSSATVHSTLELLFENANFSLVIIVIAALTLLAPGILKRK